LPASGAAVAGGLAGAAGGVAAGDEGVAGEAEGGVVGALAAGAGDGVAAGALTGGVAGGGVAGAGADCDASGAGVACCAEASTTAKEPPAISTQAKAASRTWAKALEIMTRPFSLEILQIRFPGHYETNAAWRQDAVVNIGVVRESCGRWFCPSQHRLPGGARFIETPSRRKARGGDEPVALAAQRR